MITALWHLLQLRTNPHENWMVLVKRLGESVEGCEVRGIAEFAMFLQHEEDQNHPIGQREERGQFDYRIAGDAASFELGSRSLR